MPLQAQLHSEDHTANMPLIRKKTWVTCWSAVLCFIRLDQSLCLFSELNMQNCSQNSHGPFVVAFRQSSATSTALEGIVGLFSPHEGEEIMANNPSKVNGKSATARKWNLTTLLRRNSGDSVPTPPCLHSHVQLYFIVPCGCRVKETESVITYYSY